MRSQRLIALGVFPARYTVSAWLNRSSASRGVTVEKLADRSGGGGDFGQPVRSNIETIKTASEPKAFLFIKASGTSVEIKLYLPVLANPNEQGTQIACP